MTCLGVERWPPLHSHRSGASAGHRHCLPEAAQQVGVAVGLRENWGPLNVGAWGSLAHWPSSWDNGEMVAGGSLWRCVLFWSAYSSSCMQCSPVNACTKIQGLNLVWRGYLIRVACRLGSRELFYSKEFSYLSFGQHFEPIMYFEP